MLLELGFAMSLLVFSKLVNASYEYDEQDKDKIRNLDKKGYKNFLRQFGRKTTIAYVKTFKKVMHMLMDKKFIATLDGAAKKQIEDLEKEISVIADQAMLEFENVDQFNKYPKQYQKKIVNDMIARGTNKDMYYAAKYYWPEREYPQIFFPMEKDNDGKYISTFPEDIRKSAIHWGSAIFTDADALKVYPITENDYKNTVKMWFTEFLTSLGGLASTFFIGDMVGLFTTEILNLLSQAIFSVSLSFITANTITKQTLSNLITYRKAKMGVSLPEMIIPDSESKECTVLKERLGYLMDLQDENYLNQLRSATSWDKSETLSLGFASGILRQKNHLMGMYRGQKVNVSLQDLQKNTLILGRTGGGKTLRAIMPIALQLIYKQKQQEKKLLKFNLVPRVKEKFVKDNKPYKICFYLSDAKGVLGKEIRDAAKSFGIELDKIKCIGYQVNNQGENAEYSVDLIEGMTPYEFSSTLASVGKQMSNGGGGGDDFWKDMAEMLIKSFAVIARAYSYLNNGIHSTVSLSNGVLSKSYSIYHINFLINNEEYLRNVMNEVEEQLTRKMISFNQEDHYITDSEVSDCITYIKNKWLDDMAKDTKSGFEANMKNFMTRFVDDSAAYPFTTGINQHGHVLQVSDFWHGMVYVRLPSENSSAIAINIFLKSRLFKEALNRQVRAQDRKSKLEEKFAKEFPELTKKSISIGQLSTEVLNSLTAKQEMEVVEYKKKVDDFIFISKQMLAKKKLDSNPDKTIEDFYGYSETMDAFIEKSTSTTLGSNNKYLEAVKVSSGMTLLDKVEAYFKLITIMHAKSFTADNIEKLTIKHNDVVNMAGSIQTYATDLTLAHYYKGWNTSLYQNIENLEESKKQRVVDMLYAYHDVEEDFAKTYLYYIADEYQNLVTVDKMAPSDSTFWNIARSTKTNGFIATQELAAFQKSIDSGGGNSQTKNIISNFTNKIILQVTDSESIKYAQELAGKVSRFEKIENHHYENMATYLREKELAKLKGLKSTIDSSLPTYDDPYLKLNYPQVKCELESFFNNENNINLLNIDAQITSGIDPLIDGFKVDTISKIVDLDGLHVTKIDYSAVDTRDVTKNNSIGNNDNVQIQDNTTQQASTMQQAKNRAEDKNLARREKGNKFDCEALENIEITTMGEYNAFVVINRYGVDRMDIINIANNVDINNFISNAK